MDEENIAALAAEAEYLRLRCGILEQVDRDMFGRGMAAGAACGRADEAFSASGHQPWVRSILLGILARRDSSALARWSAEAAEVRRWMAGEEFAALPERVREWMARDARMAEEKGGGGTAAARQN